MAKILRKNITKKYKNLQKTNDSKTVNIFKILTNFQEYFKKRKYV